MEAERWRKIEELFHTALEREEPRRAAYLVQACAGDDDLRHIIERLLARHQDGGDFLESPALQVLAQELAGEQASARGEASLLGQTVSRYRVLEKLGGGGMGVAYKAKDTQLGRFVALKFLRGALSKDPQALERLKREARAASALNHPNIITIHEIGEQDGRTFIVMELVDGKPLNELIPRKGMRLTEVLRIAAQVAGALTAAHAAGVVHRDLKPANIMVDEQGRVKVLDFGLAKKSAPAATIGEDEATRALTMEDRAVTEEGVILGSVPYMSPEQAEGKVVDARSDIFSFGAVLYEMITGQGAFRGESRASTLAAVVEKDPRPISEVSPATPSELERLIVRCLRKDVNKRSQNMADVMLALEELRDESESGSLARPSVAHSGGSRRRLWPAVAAGAVLAAAAVLYPVWKPGGLFQASSPALPVHRQVTFVGDADSPAISSDGKSVVYVTGKAGAEQRLMLRDLGGGQAIQLFHALRMSSPVWSPDGSEIAVYAAVTSVYTDGGIYLVPRLGGSFRFIADGATACWSPDGSKIATAWNNEQGFRLVDKVTGSVQKIALGGFQWLYYLDWSAASGLLAVVTQSKEGKGTIWTVRPNGSEQRKVFEEETPVLAARWSPTGDGIYFFRPGKGNTVELLKVSIHPKSGEAKGPASVLLSGLQVGSYLTVSSDGMRLAYARSLNYSNLWLAEFQASDRGKQPQVKPVTSGTTSFDSVSISPDGKWVAFITGPKPNVYKMAVEGGTPVQLTFSDARHSDTAWSPDGKRIAFGSDEGGSAKVWIVDADGGQPRQLGGTQLALEFDSVGTLAWWPGDHILYQKPGNRNFGILDPGTGEEKPLVQDESVGWMFGPKYSPDRTKVAVLWNRRQHPGLWVISLAGNSATPVFEGFEGEASPAGWSPDGKSIYAYHHESAPGPNLLSVPVGGGSPTTVLTLPGDIGHAVVSGDGRRIVCNLLERKSDVWLVENFDPAHRK